MAKNDELHPLGDLLVYHGQGVDHSIQVRLEGETVWLSQRQMAELYGVAVPTINEHISNIYNDEELRPKATIRKLRIVQTEGNRQARRLVEHCNLDMILAVDAAHVLRLRHFRSLHPVVFAPRAMGPKARNLRPRFSGETFEWHTWNGKSVEKRSH